MNRDVNKRLPQSMSVGGVISYVLCQVMSKNDLRLLNHTDMNIHWKALEERFLMVPFIS
jgi:hypothetical protein